MPAVLAVLVEHVQGLRADLAVTVTLETLGLKPPFSTTQLASSWHARSQRPLQVVPQVMVVRAVQPRHPAPVALFRPPQVQRGLHGSLVETLGNFRLRVVPVV